jgi:lysyl endopeptidase
MILTLKCNGKNKKAEFSIDEYVAGYPEGHPATNERKRNLRGAEDPFANLSRELAICSDDDKQNAVCYQSNYSGEYNKAKAVARLLIGGSAACTGWLVGPNNMLLTNEHCITSNSDAQNTDYQFMFESGSCGSNTASAFSTFDGTSLLKDNYSKDYALVQLTGNPVGTYG